MDLTFYGGAGEVGRSCIHIEHQRKSILLDCGIKLGEKVEYPLIDEKKIIKSIIISHAHLDHSGYLPHLFLKKTKPDIYMTKPTRDLLGVLLADYCKLQEKKVFTQNEVNAIMQEAKIIEYHEPIRKGFTITMHYAGHIMGSAMIKLRNNKNTILYTGDICTRKTRILAPAEMGIRADTLIMETTYGGRNDSLPTFKDSYGKLIKSINETLDEGGHVLIPCFAVGRAQEILMALDDYMRSGAMKPTRIFIEGMIGKTMRIYRHNAYYANEDIKKRILMSDSDPFKSESFHSSTSKTREDVLKEPCVIVSTSGMLSGGPVLFYIKKLADNPKNKMIFVGYQADGTRGKKIINGERRIEIDGEEIEIKMKIDQIKISGHSDFNELLQFAKSVKGLKKVFLIHGEKTDLKEYLEKDYEVHVPKLLERYDI